MSDKPEQIISRLFMSMFSSDELRHLIRYGFPGELSDALPGPTAAPAVLAEAVGLALVQRRDLAELWPRLIAERPCRRAEIGAARDRLDFVVFTALTLESRAMLRHLGPTSVLGLKTGTLVEIGAISANGETGLVECGPGNTNAGIIVGDAVGTLEPKAVLFVGVAAPRSRRRPTDRGSGWGPVPPVRCEPELEARQHSEENSWTVIEFPPSVHLCVMLDQQMHHSGQGFICSPMQNNQIMMSALADKIAHFPRKTLILSPSGLQVVDPEACQMHILQEMLELAQGLCHHEYAVIGTQAMRTAIEFVKVRLEELDTSFVTCSICCSRLAEMKHLFDKFQQRQRVFGVFVSNSSEFGPLIAVRPLWPSVESATDTRIFLLEDPLRSLEDTHKREQLSDDCRRLLKNGAYLEPKTVHSARWTSRGWSRQNRKSTAWALFQELAGEPDTSFLIQTFLRTFQAYDATTSKPQEFQPNKHRKARGLLLGWRPASGFRSAKPCLPRPPDAGEVRLLAIVNRIDLRPERPRRENSERDPIVRRTHRIRDAVPSLYVGGTFTQHVAVRWPIVAAEPRRSPWRSLWLNV